MANTPSGEAEATTATPSALRMYADDNMTVVYYYADMQDGYGWHEKPSKKED